MAGPLRKGKSEAMMFRETKLFILFLFFTTLCFGVATTHDPWDGTVWVVTSPNDEALVGNTYKEIYDLRKGVALRMDKEHEALGDSSAGGVHEEGTARIWFQDAVPALQPNGDALDAGDNGMMWADTNATPDNLLYILVDYSNPTVGNGWKLVSISLTAEIVAAAHQWADVQTFDVQTVHTLGILSNDDITLGAGDDLVGSATSQILMNTDKFTVDGPTGNTLIAGTANVTGTLDVVGNIDPTSYETTRGGFLDEDAMGTDSATAVASQQSIKAYVDAVTPVTGPVAGDTTGTLSTNTWTALTLTNVTSKSLVLLRVSKTVAGYVAVRAKGDTGTTVISPINTNQGGANVGRAEPSGNTSKPFLVTITDSSGDIDVLSDTAGTMTCTPIAIIAF